MSSAAQPFSQSEPLIRPFQPGDEAAFRRLNQRWIKQYFRLEAADEKVFADPVETILNPGGIILFALIDGQYAGCCALIRIAERELEVAKMAVDPAFQGNGVGRTLLRAVIDAGRKAGAKRLYLETNHQLAPAIHLYEALGFRRVADDQVHASPYARADVFMEMFLE